MRGRPLWPLSASWQARRLRNGRAVSNPFMNDTFSIAVVGVGSWGTLHARTLSALSGVALTALGDVVPSRAESLARELGVPRTFGSLDEFIGQRMADALVIATPEDSHVRIAKAALAAGIHVLVEKPVGSTSAEVRDLAAYVQQAKAVAMAGHVCMFQSQIGPLVARVRQAGFRSAHFERHRPAALVDQFPQGNPLTLTLVHDLYVATQLAGGSEPCSLDALQACRPDGRPDHMWATLRWPDGRVATFHSHWVLPPGSPDGGFDSTEVFGNGFYTKAVTNPQNWIWTEAKTNWPLSLEIYQVNGSPTGMIAEELRAFVLACQGAPVPGGCRMADAVQVQDWMERLQHSAQTKSQAHS